ncbi:hypothetical protein I307_05781 [Cryptococcus deuterogattii 99/473]|uniref:Citrate transporter-like domain-containing protein n=2 Tax=Cryptococcus deuterogattii TaxID=1859096 RepID=A0A0D0UXT0_9TREE|nr:hypothetical protein CNBG_6132 [Cryptococcus deuterogattii R265]KIR25567.1 hypothetical protein I309_05623 [Cryptococcus deuterogattii LA55]KIR37555.1 hypothetical protein I313_06557 [Cryptococcus deuterogattii Ram5]KIR69847.1 hypothetical protein I310_06412 [Cryptococcus deuterogattii CA1014]KIR89745.1 hypothetical protein I304_06464 [Cryptococcus deuterogattii CBS 10090]KIR96182.1 hypothetical protein L804_06518 [Cryptococcus deuterogattii 2001/935-1]KIY54908.1 hypothetical protein I307_
MAVTPLVDGEDRSIDVRSIVTLIVFFVVNVLVIWPVYIPLPHFISRPCRKVWAKASLSKHSHDEQGSLKLKQPARRQPVGMPGINSHELQGGLSNTLEKEDSSEEERLHMPLDLRTAPVIGVLLLLASTCIPGGVVRRGIAGSGGVRPYDIMVLFVCFAYISLSLDATGFLRYLAFLVATRSSRGDRLYTAFYVFFTALGLIFGNDPLILSGTPFLAYFTDHASITEPTAFLFTHFQVANLVSALLVSSNPTNLVLTSAFGINFLSYSAWLALPTIASVILYYPLARWCIYRRKGLIPPAIYPPPINPLEALLDPVGAIFGASIFVITVLALVGLSAGGLLEGKVGVWTVTAPAATAVFVRDVGRDFFKHKEKREGVINVDEKHPEIPASSTQAIAHSPQTTFSVAPKSTCCAMFPTVKRIISHLPLALVPFAFSFFILVEGLQHTGWIALFGKWWGDWERVGGVAGSVWLMGMLSIIGCNIFGTNIGATILLARVIQSWATTQTAVSDRSLYSAVFTLAVGSNFGAYSFVFSASLAGLLWRNILSQKGITVTLRQFIKWNTSAVIATMLIGCLIVAGEVCVMYKS